MPRPGSRSHSARRGDTLASLRTAFDLLVRLQDGAGCTVQGLAGELGLSPKQVGRYLDVLEEFGVRFDADEQGRRRSPLKLTSVRRQPPFNALFLTRDELLLLYAHLAGVHHAGDPATRARLWDKVHHNLGVAPLDGTHLAHALGHFDKAYKSYDEKRPIIADLLAALYAREACRVTYRTPHDPEARTYPVEPYELVEHDGGLYLYCWVPARAHVRLLAVERIEALERTGDTFARRADVERTIAAKKERAFRILDDEQPLRVTLRFTPAVAFYVAERTWHPTQELIPHEDGSVTLAFTATGRIEIDRWIRGWGEDCEVVGMVEVEARKERSTGQ